MNGSTVMQFLFDSYHTNLTQAVVTQFTNILRIINPTVQGAVFLYIILIGRRMMFNSLMWNEGVTKLVRGLVVMSLMSVANYQTFVATPVSTTIPNFINDMVTGQQGLQGAQAYDSLVNQTQNYSAILRSQSIGWFSIGDRLFIWFASGLARFVVLTCFFIWNLAYSTADLFVPVGALVIPFYLFDATRAWCERWYGKNVALMLVMFVNLMLGQIVVYQDAQYVQKYAQTIAARENNPDFNTIPNMENPEMFQPTTPGGNAGPTINVDSGIDTLWNILTVFAYGLFLMLISTGIALYICGASGFSAAPALGAVTAAGSRILRSR